MASDVETCENCGERIGRLEPACVWQETIVCAPCRAKLMAAATPVVAYETPQSHPRQWRRFALVGIALASLVAVALLVGQTPSPKPPPVAPVKTVLSATPAPGNDRVSIHQWIDLFSLGEGAGQPAVASITAQQLEAKHRGRRVRIWLAKLTGVRSGKLELGSSMNDNGNHAFVICSVELRSTEIDKLSLFRLGDDVAVEGTLSGVHSGESGSRSYIGLTVKDAVFD